MQGARWGRGATVPCELISTVPPEVSKIALPCSCRTYRASRTPADVSPSALIMIDIKREAATDIRIAVEHFAEIARHGHAPIAAPARNQLWIIAGAQCYGSMQQDVDVLLPWPFLKSRPLATAYGRRAGEDSFVIAVEGKSHAEAQMRFEGLLVLARYQQTWKGRLVPSGRPRPLRAELP